MNKINRDKLFKSIISISIVGTILLLLSIPFIPGFNYSPLNVLGVEVTPTQEYRIQFDLPHIKPVTPEVRQKAETHLSKLFGITQSSLKNGTLLSKPFVDIKELPITNSYIGSIKIGNATIPFSKVTKQFNKTSKDNELPSKELLTAYFRVNGKSLRANIFIMSSGSVLQYASMTLQDKDDNVLAMFTYGRAKSKKLSNDINDKLNVAVAKTESGFFGSKKVATRRKNIHYIYINDPYGNGINYYEPGNRTDVMSEDPFPMNADTDQAITMRTWGFQDRIADAYRSIYKSNFGTGYAEVGVYKITNKYALHYAADALIGSAFPAPSDFNYSPISVNFNLMYLSVSYPVYVSGIKGNWTSSFDPYYDGSSTFKNIAIHTANTPSQWSSDTFDSEWNNSIQWKSGDYSYSYLTNPDSSYKGYYTSVEFSNKSVYSAYFGDFHSSIVYTVEAGNGAFYDWYYITVEDSLSDVRLDETQ